MKKFTIITMALLLILTSQSYGQEIEVKIKNESQVLLPISIDGKETIIICVDPQIINNFEGLNTKEINVENFQIQR
jgi:hypothetical protein